MATIVIGDRGGSHISFVTGTRERDRHGPDYLSATGSFSVPGLRGELATKIYVGKAEAFRRDLQRMSDQLGGVVRFRTGEEHLGDVELSMTMDRFGRIHVAVEISHQLTQARPDYHAEIGFDADQSCLPALVDALEDAVTLQR